MFPDRTLFVNSIFNMVSLEDTMRKHFTFAKHVIIAMLAIKEFGQANEDCVTLVTMNDDLGSRLRRTRTKAGHTLDWAAVQVGLTKGYLSKVERGQSTPSIAVINGLRVLHARR